MSASFRVAASSPLAHEAMETAGRSGAGAILTLLHGYFALAGAQPGVLLSPAVMLIQVAGARRLLDGRLRQPGLEAKRPRGFLSEESPPDGAFFAAPAILLMAQVAVGYSAGGGGIAGPLRRASNEATRAGAKRRAEIFTRIAEMGGRAWAEGAMHRALLAAGGPVAGGALSPADLRSTPAVDVAASASTEGSLAWTDPAATDGGSVATECAVAMMRNGDAAVLAFADAGAGIEVEDLELFAPRAALPVRRGVQRLAPGTALPLRGAELTIQGAGAESPGSACVRMSEMETRVGQPHR